MIQTMPNQGEEQTKLKIYISKEYYFDLIELCFAFRF